MSNPYESPQWKDSSFSDQPNQPPPSASSPGMVNQVRVVGILTAVQGSFAGLMGAFLIAYGFFLPMILRQAAKNDPNFPNKDVEQMQTILLISMSLIGGATLITGLLQIYAGIRAYQFRSRGLVIGALIAGLAQSITCYCAPTAIAIAIYGLIVMFNPQVILAFQQRLQGMTGDQILASYFRGPTS